MFFSQFRVVKMKILPLLPPPGKYPFDHLLKKTLLLPPRKKIDVGDSRSASGCLCLRNHQPKCFYFASAPVSQRNPRRTAVCCVAWQKQLLIHGAIVLFARLHNLKLMCSIRHHAAMVLGQQHSLYACGCASIRLLRSCNAPIRTECLWPCVWLQYYFTMLSTVFNVG